jgi:hypothetical protein
MPDRDGREKEAFLQDTSFKSGGKRLNVLLLADPVFGGDFQR